MDLNEIAVFLKVVQTGSFSKAAQALGMPNSTVSARVASLEKRLGLTLIQRTTRRLTVTAPGRTYFERCLRGVAEFEAAENELNQDRGEPHGPLRLTAPVEIGNVVLPRVLVDFANAYPRVRLDVLLTDRRVELLAEGVDLAIRAGELADSSLVVKRIAAASFGLFASPSLFAGGTIPGTAAAIETYAGLKIAGSGDGDWPLIGPDGPVTVKCARRMTMNDFSLIKTLTVAGAGVSLLPTFYCAPEVASGQLLRLLPDCRTRPSPLQFAYPAQRFVARNVSAFIALAAQPLRERLMSSAD